MLMWKVINMLITGPEEALRPTVGELLKKRIPSKLPLAVVSGSWASSSHNDVFIQIKSQTIHTFLITLSVYKKKHVPQNKMAICTLI